MAGFWPMPKSCQVPLEEARDNLKDAIALLLEANRALAAEVASGRKIIREEIALPA